MTMSRAAKRMGSAAVLSFLMVGAPALAEEQQIAVDQVPPPVLETVKARFKGASLTNAARETEKGQLLYEVTVRMNGQDIDVSLSPAGELQMIETRIDAKNLPPAVSKALEEKYPKATWRIVEEIVEVTNGKENLAYYEILLATADKRMLEVQVTPDGKSVTEAIEDEGEEPGEEEDEEEEPGAGK